MKRYILPLLFLALTVLHGQAQSTIVPYTFTTIAGEVEIDGAGEYQDGTNGDAQFGDPASIAVDGSGNLYVADYVFNTIRKITPMGTNWVVTSLAGNPFLTDPSGYTTGGYADGMGMNALFNGPIGLAVDANGNVYVADSNNNAIRKITPDGTVTTLAGNPNLMSFGSMVGGYKDGIGTNALFDHPYGIAVDVAGNLYVADTINNVIRKMQLIGTNWLVSTLAGSPNFGSSDGLGTNAQFYEPQGIAVDTNGYVYVADTQNSTIRKITPVGMVGTLAGSAPTFIQAQNYYNGIPFGYMDGTGPGAQFFFPYTLAVDAMGNIYVADSYNDEMRKVSPLGVVTTLGGSPSFTLNYNYGEPYPLGGYANGAGSASRFFVPSGVAVDDDGNLYVSDEDNFVIRKGVAPQVQVVALEVTQVIQDWSNSIPLIQGKETYVRAHLQLPLSGSATEVMVSGAQLYGSNADSALPGSPISAINSGGELDVRTFDATDTYIRGYFTNSLNFRLPPSWLSNTITLQLGWSGGLVPTNTVSNNCSVQVTFIPVTVPQIKFFSVEWTDLTGTVHGIDTNILYDLSQRVLSTYPVASLDAVFGTVDYSERRNPIPVTANQLLSTQRFLDSLLGHLPFGTPVGNRLYHGALTSPGGGGFVSGLAVTPLPSQVSSSYVLAPYGNTRQTVSHELAHNLGIQHDLDAGLFGQFTNNGVVAARGACKEDGPLGSAYPFFQPYDGIPNAKPTLGPTTFGTNALIYGLDTATLKTNPLIEAVIMPTNMYTNIQYSNCCFDLMSYCANSNDLPGAWPSSVTYRALINRITNTFGPPPPNLLGGGGGGTFLIVRGMVDFGAGTAAFLPCMTLTTTNTPPEPAAGTNFTLEALDVSGNVLQTTEFTIENNLYEENDTNEIEYFIAPIRENAAIHSLRLYYQGVLLTTTTASAHAPTVTLFTPNGGQNYASGPINVTWSASDADSDTLSYTVQYSPDNGTSWETLGVDLPSPSLTVNSAELTASTTALIRVIASDGFNTGSAQSAATFTVQPHAPAVTINTPMAGAVFIGDQQLFLDATAFDMQDGALDGTNVQWRSDMNGSLGSGAVLTFDPMILSEGFHTMTVTAKDSAGLTNSATTKVLVLHYPPPQLSIQAFPGFPGYEPPYVTITWPSYYTNYVLQGSSNLISGWVPLSNHPPQTVANLESVNWNLSKTNSLFRLIFQP